MIKMLHAPSSIGTRLFRFVLIFALELYSHVCFIEGKHIYLI